VPGFEARRHPRCARQSSGQMSCIGPESPPMKVWVVAWLTVFMLGCEEKCNSRTCAGGCCDSEGQCVSGRSPIACGSDGAQCNRCERNQVCTSQACVMRPDAGARDAGIDAGPPDGGFVIQPCICPRGCCSPSGLCEQGVRPDACGTDGGVCVSCQPQEVCSNFVCLPIRCDGCSLGDGRCLPGLVPSGCGADGGLCVTCDAGQSCTQGQCITLACGPDSCPSGCCLNGACAAGSTSMACGRNGTVCRSCDGGCIDGGCS
jgi:hypothetical protein